MIVFYSDLDNTLIYSYKRELPLPKRCVELYQGREVSFMTERSAGLLEQVRELVEFVPTTTRTIEQYERILLGGDVPRYALVCNGGVLLRDGKRDEEWYRTSLELVSDCKEEFARAIAFLENDVNRSFEIRFIEELFVFTKSEKPGVTAAALRERLNPELVEVFENGVKVYVVPRILSKGNAILRLNRMLNPELTFAAGDSEFDVSMLCAAEVGLAPQMLDVQEEDNKIVKFNLEKEVFSESLLSYIIEIVKG